MIDQVYSGLFGTCIPFKKLENEGKYFIESRLK